MIDNDTAQSLAAGASGSGVAVWLSRAVGLSLAVMFLGGLAAAYFIGPVVIYVSNLPPRYGPAMGFVVGFVAIMMLRKTHEALDSIPAKSFGRALIEWWRKRLGLPPVAEDKETEK